MKVFYVLIFCVLLFASCAPNNVTVDKSLGRHFKEANTEGCFAVLDNANGQFTIYNLARYRDTAFVPGATFDLVTALVGLQTGIISSDSMVLNDSSNRTSPVLNKGITMYEALRASATPYFQEVARRIGRDTLQHFLDSIAYGTKKLRTSVDSFWLDGSLKLTPDEQLGFIKRMYFGQLPFFKVNQETIKRALVQEQNSAYTLAYKNTPLVWDSTRKKYTGWITGWIEQDRQPRFFVLNLDTTNPNFSMATVGTPLLRRILQQLGFLQAKQ